jgi:hypothetical protein
MGDFEGDKTLKKTEPEPEPGTENLARITSTENSLDNSSITDVISQQGDRDENKEGADTLPPPKAEDNEEKNNTAVTTTPQQQPALATSASVIGELSKNSNTNESGVQLLKDITVSIGGNNTMVNVLKVNKDVYYSEIGGTVVKHTINVLDDTKKEEKDAVIGYIRNPDKTNEDTLLKINPINGGKKKNSKKRGAKRSIKGGNSTSLTGAPFTGGRTRGHRGKNGKYGKKKSMKTYWGGSDTGANVGTITSATTLSPALYKGGSEKMAGGNSAPTVPLSSDLPGYTPNSLATTASAYAGGKRRSKKSKSTKKGKKAKRHTRK